MLTLHVPTFIDILRHRVTLLSQELKFAIYIPFNSTMTVVQVL